MSATMNDTHARLLIPDHLAFPLEYDQLDTLHINVELTVPGDYGGRIGANLHEHYSLPLLAKLPDRIMFYAWEIDRMVKQLIVVVDGQLALPVDDFPYTVETNFHLTGGPIDEENQEYERMFYCGGVNFTGRLPLRYS